MSTLIAEIRKQIGTCEMLLQIFQQERRQYLDRPDIELDDLQSTLAKKKQATTIIVSQTAQLRGLDNELQPAEQEQKRQLLRQLGGLLEQLLVIEHENEIALRERLGAASAAKRPGLRPSRLSRLNMTTPGAKT